MKMGQFLRIVNQVLADKGLPVSIHDLPDVDFYNYFDEDMDENEARDAAEELILCESDNLGIPEELLDF
jgi:hypothetical protein